MELKELQERIQKYQREGFGKQVASAVKRARGQTREYIERTHPQTAFGGKSLIIDNFNNRTNHQTVLGHFEAHTGIIWGTLFANYFQRWYSTGAKQHNIMYGRYKGRKSTYYDARGSYYTTNKSAIEQNFADNLNKALDEFIKI